MSAAKRPTPQAISALLRRSGFARMAYSKSRIRGLKEHSAGYEVHSEDNGDVYVTWWPSSFNRSRDVSGLNAMLAKYAPVIEGAGYAILIEDTGWLRITGKDARRPATA